MTVHYAPPRHTLKQGDTLDLSGFAQLDDGGVAILTGWSGAAQVRDMSGVLIEALTFEWLDASQGLMRIYSVNDTTAWPVGRAQFDVQFTTGTGEVVSTPTVYLTIEGDVTT